MPNEYQNNPSFPELRNLDNSKDWLGLSLAPEYQRCGTDTSSFVLPKEFDKIEQQDNQYSHVEQSKIDCECKSTNLADAGADTLSCIDQKMKFTASLLSVRFVCENLRHWQLTQNQLNDPKYDLIRDKCSKHQMGYICYEMNWDVFTISSSQAMKIVNGCLDYARHLNNSDIGQIRAASLEFLNICLNMLQNCKDMKQLENGTKIGCVPDLANYWRWKEIALKIKQQDLKIHLLNRFTLLFNVALQCYEIQIEKEVWPEYDLPISITVTLGSMQYKKLLQNDQKQLTGKSKKLKFGEQEVLALAGIGLNVFSEIDLPGSLEHLFDQMGDFMDLIDVHDTLHEYIQHKSELFKRTSEMDARQMRLQNMDMHSAIFSSLIKLVAMRGHQHYSRNKEMWIQDREMIKWNKMVPVHTELLSVTHEVSKMFDIDNRTEVSAKQILDMIMKRKRYRIDKTVKERDQERQMLIDQFAINL